MVDEDYFTIRWRWLFAGLGVACVCGLIVFAVHEWQVSRIGRQLLAAARHSAHEADFETARRHYTSYLGLIPRDASAREEYAQLILSEPHSVSNDRTVMELLDDAIHDGSTRPETRIELIRTAVRLERFGTAARLLDSMNLTELGNAELFALKGLCSLKKGDDNSAGQAFRTALKIDDQCAGAWEGLVKLAETTDGLEAAISVADQMAAEVDGPAAYSVKGHLLVKNEQPAQAGRAFWHASKKAGNDFETATEFADFIMYNVPPTEDMDLEMIQAAYDALAASVKTTDYMTSARLGDLAHRLRQTDQAILHYQQCLQHRPADAFAIGRAVEVLASAGQSSAAHRMLDSMAEYRSLALLRHTLRAGLYAQEERFRDASDLLEEVVRSSGNHRLREGAYFLLVECLWEQRRLDEAIVFSRELLKQSEGRDNARNLLIASLIHGERYEEAVAQLQQFRSPHEHLGRNLSLLIEKAESTQQISRLKKYVDKSRIIRASAPLAVIFDAYLLTDAGKTSQAVSILSKAAAENPEALEYWSAAQAVRRRSVSRMRQPDSIEELADIADRLARTLYLTHQISHDREAAVAMTRRYFAAQPKSLEPLQLIAAVVEHSDEDQETIRQFVAGLHTELAAALRDHTVSAVPPIVRTLLACGHEPQAFQVLSGAAAQTDDRTILKIFCQNIGKANRNETFAQDVILSDLLSGQLKCTETGRQLILAEIDAVNEDLEPAITRVQKLVASQMTNTAAVESLLRLCAYDSERRTRLTEYGYWLQQQHPDDADAVFAVSCGLRAAHRYPEAVRHAVKAFSMRQDPAFLLHAAYSEWLADRTDSAAGFLQLAYRVGLSADKLHVLDQKLLRQLETDPEVHDSVISDSDGKVGLSNSAG